MPKSSASAKTPTRRDGTAVTTRQARRGYSWEPFREGNTVAMTHGTRSEQAIAAKAEEVTALLIEYAPELAQPLFREARERYCRAEAMSRMLSSWIFFKIETEGVESVPPSLWADSARFDSNAQKFASDLGLDPAGAARIHRDLGLANQARNALLGRKDGVEELSAEGRAIREVRTQEAIGAGSAKDDGATRARTKEQ